jgi:hypothetical protein
MDETIMDMVRWWADHGVIAKDLAGRLATGTHTSAA